MKQAAERLAASMADFAAALPDDANPVQKAVQAAQDAGADAAYQPLFKGEDERRYTLGVAFAADCPEKHKALDGRRDVIKAQAVEDAAWGFLANAEGRQIGLWHADGEVEKGTVVESYIWRGPDWSLIAADGSEQVVKQGDWLLGVVWSETAWTLLKAGLIDGLSPQGRALRQPASED